MKNYMSDALKDYDEAMKLLRVEKKRRNDRIATVVFNRAQLFDATGDYVRSSLTFSEYIDMRVLDGVGELQLGTALNNRGLAHMRLDKLDAALHSFTEAIRCEPVCAVKFLSIVILTNSF